MTLARQQLSNTDRVIARLRSLRAPARHAAAYSELLDAISSERDAVSGLLAAVASGHRAAASAEIPKISAARSRLTDAAGALGAPGCGG